VVGSRGQQRPASTRHDGAVITQPSFPALAVDIRARPPRCGPVRLVAVDGPAGAGKSTFASALAAALGNVPVIPNDDFASWKDPFGWWDRFELEVLRPLGAGSPARYQANDWAAGGLGRWVNVPVTEAIVVEGVSSARRAVADRLTFAVWVDAPREVRMRRGLERDGVGMRAHWDRWMAAEDAFFEADGTRDRADLVVDGDASAP
jgi:hypothetical protein